MDKVITKHFDVPRMNELKVARQHGAYLSLKKLLRMEPEEVIELVTRSGLRGRGGAGFPTGKKWSSVPKNSGQPVYLVVNADEGEPGTFKDRAILERNPHLLIEGIIIAAHAIGAKTAFVYIRGEYSKPMSILSRAVDEAHDARLLKKNKIIIHRSAGAYICGEESALLNSIEGLRGISRIRPPYPVTKGLFGCPTVVNNVETFACLPFILREGADVFKKLGTGESSGTKLVSVCGHVERPGVYEIEMGLPISSFISKEAGGVLGGRSLKAVIPGGISVPVLTASEALACTIDYESLEEAGSALGSGGMIVMDESARMPSVLADIARFFAHESCGQCTPCREGTGWIDRVSSRIENGFGRDEDINLLMDVASAMERLSLCRLARHVSLAVVSLVTKFRGEFEEYIQQSVTSNQ